MSKLIRLVDRQALIEDDHFTLIRDAAAEIPADGNVIVPAAVWAERIDDLRQRHGRSGAWLAPAEDPAILKDSFKGLALIAVDFPKFTDGRGYSTATLLRRRYDWLGEIRAIGEVLRDQLFYMARTGIDAFAVPVGKDARLTAGGLDAFTEFYQDAVGDPNVPVFRRRAAAVREAKIARTTAQLKHIVEVHSDAALASSLGAEDMVLTDLISRLKLPIHIFTLDTGRLNEETLGMIGETRARYGIDIEVMHPVAAAVDAHVAANGAYAFYESLALRKECCGIRKVEPLNRALKGRSAWVTGQRRDQAVTRSHLAEVEHDDERNMAKFNPLADWNWDDVLAYAARYDVPLNPLHARGYPSIGCEPCTRAIRPGEDPRAGRWWWEQSDSKECGLHEPGTISPVLEAAS